MKHLLTSLILALSVSIVNAVELTPDELIATLDNETARHLLDVGTRCAAIHTLMAKWGVDVGSDQSMIDTLSEATSTTLSGTVKLVGPLGVQMRHLLYIYNARVDELAQLTNERVDDITEHNQQLCDELLYKYSEVQEEVPEPQVRLQDTI